MEHIIIVRLSKLFNNLIKGIVDSNIGSKLENRLYKKEGELYE